MPYTIRKIPIKSARNWAILDERGHIVGRSFTQENAKSSVRARLAGERGWRGTNK
jgi:hypothetical protein